MMSTFSRPAGERKFTALDGTPDETDRSQGGGVKRTKEESNSAEANLLFFCQVELEPP